MISRELSPYVDQVVGIDVSQGMVDQFNARVSYQGIPSEEMQAVCCDLKGEKSELSGKKFDVIVVSFCIDSSESFLYANWACSAVWHTITFLILMLLLGCWLFS